MPTKERANKINNSPAEEEEDKDVSPPPQRSASLPTHRMGIYTLGNGKISGGELRGDLEGNDEETKVVQPKWKAKSEIDDENAAAARKPSQDRGAGSETSLSASPVRSPPPSKTSSGVSRDYCLKDATIEEMETRKYAKRSNTTDALPKIEYCPSERIGITETTASEKRKEELLISNEAAESQEDNKTARSVKMKHVDAVHDEEATVLTVPKEEKMSVTRRSKVIAPIEPVNNKDDSSSTRFINERISSPNNTQLQIMHDGSSSSKERIAGDAAGQQLMQQGTASFTDSGSVGGGISVSVDKEAAIHVGMDTATNTPSKQQEEEGLIRGKKTCHIELEISPTAAAPSSPSYLQMVAAESNLDMDAVNNKVPAKRSNDGDDPLSPIKKFRKTDDNGLLLMIPTTTTTSRFEKVSDEGTNVVAPALKPNASGETESTSHNSMNTEITTDSVVSRSSSSSSSVPGAKCAVQQEPSSVHTEGHMNNNCRSLDGIIISNRQQHSGDVMIVDINSQTSTVKEQKPRAKEDIKKGSRKGGSTDVSTRDLALVPANVSEEEDQAAEGIDMGTILDDICKSENGGPSAVSFSSDIPSAQRKEDVSTKNDFPNGNGRCTGDDGPPSLPLSSPGSLLFLVWEEFSDSS